MRRAQELDPVSSVTNGALAGMLYNARDFDGSIAYSKRSLELEPSAFAARLNLGEALLQKRMFNEAHEAFDKVRESRRVTATGKSAMRMRWLVVVMKPRECLLKSKSTIRMRREITTNYALVYGALGEKDKAFAEMERMRTGPSQALRCNEV